MAVLAQIVAAGASIPRLRLPRATIAAAMGWLGGAARAQGARSFCNWDEDALTLAIDAARGALAGAPPVDALFLASTTLPFADRSNAALAAACLDLDAQIETLEFGGSLRAATGALTAAAKRAGTTLVVGSDARLARPGSPQEPLLGHGAAALLVRGVAATGATAPALCDVLATAHEAADFVDHYRMSGSDFDYALEERWIRDEALAGLPARVVRAALARAGVAPEAVTLFAMPGANAKRVAAEAGLARAALVDPLQAIAATPARRIHC
jgi:hydroxymethylglutaryl-CoA synthase